MTEDATDTPTPAELREQAEERLIPRGERRKQLVAQLEELDEELRPDVLAARRAEVSLRRIHALTGISPNTIRAMEARSSAAKKRPAP